MPAMAYSPVAQGRLLAHPGLAAFARDCDITPAQVALAWLLAQDDIIAISKAGTAAHVAENAAAADIACHPPSLRT